MRMFLYFAVHSVKNQLKKLFKTWVAVFLGICMLFGLLIGFGVAFLEDAATPEYTSSYEDEYYEEVVTDEIPEDAAQALITSAVLLLTGAMCIYNLLSGGKDGGKSFTMADVNILFASPRSPQSVLLFKLLTQLGAAFLASLYLVFQLPNLVLNLGLSPLFGVALLVCWVFVLVFSKLCQMLSYTAGSVSVRYKRLVRVAVVALLAAVCALFYIKLQKTDKNIFEFAIFFFSSKYFFFLPMFGWAAAFIHFCFAGSLLPAGAFLLLCLASIVGLCFIIWNIKADFYEDSLNASAEMAELQQAAAEGRVTVVARKKPRAEKINREGLNRGFGANVYLYKSLYNRFRFAKLRIFTKTNITYLLVSAVVCALQIFVFDTRSLTAVALTLCLLVFYRSLGNPVNQDIEHPLFTMLPESAHKKLFFSLFSGTVDCFLDLIPAFAVGTLALGANPLHAVLWLLFAVTIDLYSSSVGTFISLSIPVSAAKIIQSIIQICFIYFGLLPIAALVAVGLVLDLFVPCMLAAALFSTLCGALFFALTPLFITNGRK